MKGISDMSGFPQQNPNVPKGLGPVPFFFHKFMGNTTGSSTVPVLTVRNVNLQRDKCYHFRVNMINSGTTSQFYVSLNRDHDISSSTYWRHLVEFTTSATMTNTNNSAGMIVIAGVNTIFDIYIYPGMDGNIYYRLVGNTGVNQESMDSWGFWVPTVKQNVTEINFHLGSTGIMRYGSTITGMIGW